MSKVALERDIIIEESDNNYRVRGYVSISCSEIVDVELIEGFVYLEVRGRMASQKHHVVSFTISDKKRLQTAETYKFPFSFEMHDLDIGTYKGKNVNFTYKCEAKIHIEDDDIDKIDRSFFSKVKSFVTSDDSLKVSTYFHVDDSLSTYQIEETTTSLDFKTNFLMSFIASLLTGGIYAFLIPEFNAPYMVFGVFLIIAVIISIKLLVGNALGEVTMETLRDEDAFLCTIKKTKKFSLVNQYLYYQIIEKVVDDRGTSSSTVRSTIYTSKKEKISTRNNDVQVKFSYPEIKNIHSNYLGDVSIYWVMNLKGTTYLGFILKYQCEFTVRQRRQVLMS
ncbi:hypothetical protein [uncultured Dokdonia sp.]|uniref:hypothetical protein n=1 Tax=uncultured Dokdonia sp. TaxID=575653 RepID=UPI002615CF5F|nr:hypothetical protein [uncultured Dokdonia sp.]